MPVPQRAIATPGVRPGTDLDVDAYLERLRYRGSRAATAETLRDLQLAHLLAVPFENLSLHAGEPIVLEDGALFDKIVVRRRGGFCYELNGLFAALLRALGFEVTMLAARVADGEGGYSPAFDHMALMVELEDRWLVDVGFGDTFREPLLLDERDVQQQAGGAYRVDADGERLVLVERKPGGSWKPQYCFALRGYAFADYEDRCRFHQTSPDSHFRKSRMCSRATPDGRLTSSDLRLIETSLDGERRERTVADEAERERLLAERFGIRLRRNRY